MMDFSKIKPRLILCDTIDRGSSKVEIQVESFRFQQLIQIAEIRIISFGVAVESKLSGDVRLGVTYPSSFDIEFFVHSKHEQCAFEPIGRLSYSEKNRETVFRPKQIITANCLILRARYSTLTLAIFGFPTTPSQPLPNYPLQTFRLSGPPQGLPPQQYPGQPPVNQSVPPFSTNVPPPMRPPLTNFPPINLSHPPPTSGQPPIRPDIARPPPPLPPVSQPQGGILEPGEIEDRNRQLINQGYSGSTNQRSSSPTFRPKSLLGEGPEGSRLVPPGVSPTNTHKSGGAAGKSFAEHKSSHTGSYTPDKHESNDRSSAGGIDQSGSKSGNSTDNAGLYEDGEIQDVDYEDISNEDLFEFDDPELSADDNDDLSEDNTGKTSLNNTWNALSTKFESSQWRVNANKLLETGDSLCPSLTVFLDPSLTLFDLECLRIQRDLADDSEYIDQESPSVLKQENDSKLSDSQRMKQEPFIETKTDIKVEYCHHATRLKHLVQTFSESQSHGSQWIEELEHLVDYIRPGLALLSLRERSTADEVIATLVDWTFECLDITSALRQSDNAFILRHLKAGVSLAGTLGSMNDEILSVLVQRGVQDSLLTMLQSPFVATTLKLSLLRALDLTTRLSQGIEAFLGMKSDSDNDMQEEYAEDKETPFKKFVEYLFCAKTARVSSACIRLLNKVQFYEALLTFKELVVGLVEYKRREGCISDESTNQVSVLTHLLSDSVRVLVSAEQLIACPRASLPCTVVFDKSKYKPHNPYPDLFHMYKHTNFLSNLSTVVNEVLIDTQKSLSNLETKTKLKQSQILHSFVEVVCDLLEELSNNQLGLQYLASQGRSLTNLLRGIRLLDDVESDASEVVDKEAGEDVDMEKTILRESSRCSQIAQSVTYKVLTLSYLDTIVRQTKKSNLNETDIDQIDLIRAVFGLYILVNDKESVKAVVEVIAMDENVNTLLPLLEIIDRYYSTKNDDYSDKADKLDRPMVLQLMPSIIISVLRLSENVDYLDKYGLPLFALGKDTSSLCELQEWLMPLKQLSSPSPFELESIPDLVGQLKTYVEEIDDLPAGLVILLRILRSVIIPPPQISTTEKIDYIKYRYALVEFYSLDGVPALVSILQKLTDIIRPQWYQGVEHTDPRYSYITSALLPLLTVLCHTTQLMIRCRRSEFRDTTALLPLFNAYTVFCCTPMKRAFDPDVDKLRVLIVDTLLAYTQNSLPDEENEEALDKSLWTCLLRELLKFTTTTSSTFISGLSILRELLPLPLPLVISTPLSNEEIQQLTSARTLWSAHMLCVETEFRAMLAMLGCSSNPHVELLLRSLCQRVADLGTACCIMVAQTALRIVIEFWNRNIAPGTAASITLPGSAACSQGQTREGKEGSSTADSLPSQTNKEDEHCGSGMEISVIGSTTFSGGPNISLTNSGSSAAGDSAGAEMSSAGPADTLEVSRAFSMLRLVLSVSSCKAAILNLLEGRENTSGDEETEDYFSRLYPMMNSILCTHVSHDHHISTQEKLIGCLRQLLKVEPPLFSNPPVTFSSSEDMECQNYYKPAKGSKCDLSDLANCLPCKEHMELIINDLIAHVNNPDQDLSTVHLALRVLVMIMDSDYGFCIVKEAVNKNPDVFLNLIKRVNNTFSKDNPDCQLTLLTTLELLRTLVMTDNLEGETRPMRTQAISPQEIKDLLGWKKTEQIHPVTELNSLLKAYVEDEQSLEILLDSMDSLIALLETLDDDAKPFVPLSLVYPTLPSPISLTQMFKNRPFFLLLSDLDSTDLKQYRSYNNAKTWLTLPAVPSFDDVGKPELVRCDLENLAYTCCSGFKLQEELAKGHQRDEDDALRHKRRRKGHDAIISTGKSNKKFVAPMRGRGFSIRGGSANSMNTRQDSFRSRPANTSRPPSMHVDDFVKMEQTEDVIPNEESLPRPDRSGSQFKSLRGGRGGSARKSGGYAGNWEGRRNTSSDVKVLTGEGGDFNTDSEFRAPHPHSWNTRREHRHLRSLTK